MSLTEHLSEPLDHTTAAAPQARDTARQTLAMRIAHRNRLRAERLARLHFPMAGDDAEPAGPPPGMAEPPGQSALLTRRPPEPAAPVRPATASIPETEAAPEKAEAGFGLSAAEAADASDALEEFLRVLSGSMADPVVPVDEPEPAAILQFQRPGPATDPAPAHMPRPLAAPVCDLDRLRGVGPGLIWALNRAGIACLAEMALLEAEDLTTRLGPLGRLVPAAAWIATARAAEAD